MMNSGMDATEDKAETVAGFEGETQTMVIQDGITECELVGGKWVRDIVEVLHGTC
jgi:hypothetical protein